jgi:hypothetical protein
MPVSPLLKDLLKRFGEIQATTSFYARSGPEGPVEYPGENYPAGDLEPGEPALIVKISQDGESRIQPAVHHDGSESQVVSVMELPEDEFWYFEAFRPALSRLALGAPGFLAEMELVTLYGVFEAYLGDMLRDRLRGHPHLLGAKARRDLNGLGDVTTRDPAAVDRVVAAEIRRLTYGSITALLTHMRTALDMPGLTPQFDASVQTVALVRNCLLHAGGKVDERLAAADPRYTVGELLALAPEDAARMAKALRDLAYAIDQQQIGELP